MTTLLMTGVPVEVQDFDIFKGGSGEGGSEGGNGVKCYKSDKGECE